MALLKSTDTEIVYGLTAGKRWAGGLLGLFMLAVSSGIPVLLWNGRAQYVGQPPLVQAGPVAFGLYALMLGMTILLIFLVQEDIVLDLKTRTYRYRGGLPLLTRWHTGPFSDIRAVALRKVSTKQGGAFRVSLLWYKTEQGFLRALLGDLRDFIVDISSPLPQAEAETERELVSRKLTLPAPTSRGGAAREEEPEQIRRRSLRMTIFGAMVGAVLILGLFGPDLLLAAQFQRQGRSVRGIVTGARPFGNGSKIEFTYSASGRALHGEDTISARDAPPVTTGDSVAVIYLPDYPLTYRTRYSTASLSESLLRLGILGIPLILVSLFYVYRFRPQP